MTQDEINDIYHEMEKRITEMENKMDKKMHKNKEEIKNHMKELQNLCLL
jgi:vacuolar-type H+-ATPase subunit E/Vma4